MKESVKRVYKCDWCGKNYLRKHSAAHHEKYCGKNPNNRHACFSCSHLEVDQCRADDGFIEKTFKCTKLDKDLHSFKAEKIKHSCLGYTERMPLQCDSFKDRFVYTGIDF
jgi:hypothetical protein